MGSFEDELPEEENHLNNLLKRLIAKAVRQSLWTSLKRSWPEEIEEKMECSIVELVKADFGKQAKLRDSHS